MSEHVLLLCLKEKASQQLRVQHEQESVTRLYHWMVRQGTISCYTKNGYLELMSWINFQLSSEIQILKVEQGSLSPQD